MWKNTSINFNNVYLIVYTLDNARTIVRIFLKIDIVENFTKIFRLVLILVITGKQKEALTTKTH
jgi:hypothetical protein